jgi:hypothetical protein
MLKTAYNIQNHSKHKKQQETQLKSSMSSSENEAPGSDGGEAR